MNTKYRFDRRTVLTISVLLMALWISLTTFAQGLPETGDLAQDANTQTDDCALCQKAGAESHGHAIEDGQKMGVMGDYHARSMMMDQIAENSEMRQEMMHKMMQSMDMHKMMNDPEMKTRMKKHVAMMQAMLDSEAMDPTKMKEMMDNPEMMSMMKMHMMCAQTENGEMMGKHSKESNEIHAH